MDGYVLTEGPALEHAGILGVRYAATLAGGGGFLATDDLDRVRDLGDWIEPSSFFWPWRAAPKRAVGNGEEVFGLVSVDMLDVLEPMATGLAPVHLSPALVARFGVGPDDLGLVETQGARIPLAIWQARVTSFSDARLVTV